jgi:hypothetical protein
VKAFFALFLFFTDGSRSIHKTNQESIENKALRHLYRCLRKTINVVGTQVVVEHRPTLSRLERPEQSQVA